MVFALQQWLQEDAPITLHVYGLSCFMSVTLVEIFGPGQKFLDLYSSGDQKSEGQMGEAYRA
jgi:hypothetical protein